MLLTIGLYFAVAVVILSIALKIPGLELLIKPVFDLLTKIIEFILVALTRWMYWCALEIISAHNGLIDHALHDEEHYDVSLRVDRMNRDA